LELDLYWPAGVTGNRTGKDEMRTGVQNRIKEREGGP
jgi:hypothetical protein